LICGNCRDVQPFPTIPDESGYEQCINCGWRQSLHNQLANKEVGIMKVTKDRKTIKIVEEGGVAVVSGSTYNVRDLLKDCGFRYVESGKVWTGGSEQVSYLVEQLLEKMYAITVNGKDIRAMTDLQDDEPIAAAPEVAQTPPSKASYNENKVQFVDNPHNTGISWLPKGDMIYVIDNSGTFGGPITTGGGRKAIGERAYWLTVENFDKFKANLQVFGIPVFDVTPPPPKPVPPPPPPVVVETTQAKVHLSGKHRAVVIIVATQYDDFNGLFKKLETLIDAELDGQFKSAADVGF